MDNEVTILNRGAQRSTVSTGELITDGNSLAELKANLDPQVNAALLFDSSWHNAQASELKTNLLAIIFGGRENVPAAYLLLAQTQNEGVGNFVNQTFETLIARALDHPNFENLRAQPKIFWDQVRQMSEVRLVDSYVNGKLEPRAVSRYGELVEQLNRSGQQLNQNGERLKNFLASLPSGEREIFEARYRIFQTFGANELFVGNGITLDKHGQFPVRGYLMSGGKNPELSPHTVLSLLGGNVSFEKFESLKDASIFTNEEVLLSVKSAALLSLNLAFYQNVNARLSLEDVAFNSFSPKSLSDPTEQVPTRLTNQNVFENGKVNGRTTEAIVIAGFINGGLAALDKFKDSGHRKVGAQRGNVAANLIFGFSAGATGVLMGASIGCLVPLAESSVGEILGFTASVVIGLTNSGVRTMDAARVVYIIKSGVQNILDVAGGHRASQIENFPPRKFLKATESSNVFENDLRRQLFSNRLKILSAT
ncbi:MAG: hypothetical protein ABJA66_08385 [Actinomycetota bacterium]